MTDTDKAIAAAYADAAGLAWSDEDDRPWEHWGEYRNITVAQTVAKEIAAAILARAAAVAANPALIGVEPWTPPPEAGRPDGYECYITVPAKWDKDDKTWSVADSQNGDLDAIYVRDPIAFAPLPTAKETGE